MTEQPRTAAGTLAITCRHPQESIESLYPLEPGIAWLRCIACDTILQPRVEVLRLLAEAQARPAVASERLRCDECGGERSAIYHRVHCSQIPEESGFNAGFAAGRKAALASDAGSVPRVVRPDWTIEEGKGAIPIEQAGYLPQASDAGSVGALDVERLADAMGGCCVEAGTIEHAQHVLDRLAEPAAAYDAERQGEQ